MIIPKSYKGKHVGVFGLARTGLAAIRSLTAAGAHVWAWDDDAERRKLAGPNAIDLENEDLSLLDALLLAPGIPTRYPEPHPVVFRARAAGVPLISDFDLFEAARADLPVHKVVTITGTNGKSTSVALITHILKSAGHHAVMTGNIGVPLLSIQPLPAGGIYVIEASSFQLELTRCLDSDVAVLLNMAPDHLDRHGTMDDYMAAKARVFAMQSEGRVAIVGDDDDHCRAVALQYPGCLRISAGHVPSSGVGVVDGIVFDALKDIPALVGTLLEAHNLKGRHNWQNASAAYGVCRILGLSAPEVIEGLNSFKGLAHRQEKVAERPGLIYINDSKATNVAAASRALATYKNIFWIAGGSSKGEDYAALIPHMPHVTAAFFIGAEGPMLNKALGDHVDAYICSDLDEAAVKATDMAVKTPGQNVILLSPACPAFDQFKDFEERGHRFRALAEGFAR